MNSASLSEVVVHRAGYWGSESTSSGSDVQVVRNGDIGTSGRVNWDRVPSRSLAAKQVSAARIQVSDILLTTSGNCGNVAFVESQPPDTSVASNFVRILRPTLGAALEPRYLYWFLRGDDFISGIQPFIRGTTLKNLSTVSAFASVRIPMPPIEEQRRIADILDRADALRAKRREALAHLDDLTQSIFLDMFGDPLSNERRWPTATVGHVADIQGGLQVSAARNSLARKTPYLRVANVHRGRLDLNEIKEIGLTDGELERTRLSAGDLLIVEGHGNPDEIGRAALWDGSIDGCVHQNHLIRARFSTSRMLPDFAEAYLNSRGGRRYLLRSGKTTSGLNTISTSNVKHTPIALPPIERQKAFAVRLSALDEWRSVSEAHARELGALFASLRQRAFAGQL